MCKFIGIERVAANAIIELFERKGEKRIDLASLDKYGMKVIEMLEKNTNEGAVFIFNRDGLRQFFIDYSDYFRMEQTEEQTFIVMQDSVTCEDLKNKFRWSAPYEILKAILAPSCLEVLGVA